MPRSVFISILASVALGACRDEARPPAPAPPAPPADGRWLAAALEPLNAAHVRSLVTTADVVVVALWATWCTPCIEEMPELQAFAAAHPDRVVVLGLATDPPADDAAIQKVLDRVRPTYPQARLAGGEGPFLGALSLAWDGMLPKTVALPRDGAPFLLTPPVTRTSLEAALAAHLSRR